MAKKRGLGGRKTGPIPAQADPIAEPLCLDAELTAVLDEAQAGCRQVFFVDAAHLVLGAGLGCLTRILLSTPSGRQRINVLGALPAIRHPIITVTHDTDINREIVVTLLKKRAEQVTDRPIPLVLDNARYERHASVLAEAARLEITWLWLPTHSPHRNLIARLGKCVQADGLCREYRWGLPGRYDPTCGRFKQAIRDCLADTSGRHQAQLNTLLTRKFPVFKAAA